MPRSIFMIFPLLLCFQAFADDGITDERLISCKLKLEADGTKSLVDCDGNPDMRDFGYYRRGPWGNAFLQCASLPGSLAKAGATLAVLALATTSCGRNMLSCSCMRSTGGMFRQTLNNNPNMGGYMLFGTGFLASIFVLDIVRDSFQCGSALITTAAFGEN